ncbi:hypothetical protein LMG23992_01504 [Cupriavidus laharis]|uniref:DUF2950 domain-containing protein n=1 Tax=Cupriavidus laharis TaxID=151654 RepID=A0ABM8WRV1_9BURK|nr:DUF2950 domain-containing protein [Cupriavidus laharis]CAG9170192.1 hypothetical protein LMG23992_01504 [Cupriavidus laharis]
MMRKSMSAMRVLVAFAALSAGLPALAQQSYPTPDAAAEALGDAIARSDDDALKHVLGNNYHKLLPPSGVDRDDVYDFLAAWARHHGIQPDGERRALLAVGESGWTFPVPLVRQKNGWQFDLRAGEREVLRRRLGRNELVAMETLLQLADAQERFAQQVGNGRYAAQLVSSPGKTNGLYWPSTSQENASPVGPDALAMVPETPADSAFYGYHYRVIAPPKGSDAKYAFVAWPAQYGQSGIHTFLLGSDKVFYERDLGSGTAARAGTIRSFSPDGWQRVADH